MRVHYEHTREPTHILSCCLISTYYKHSFFTCSNTAILHTTFCLYMFKHSLPTYDILSLHVQTQPSCMRHSVFTCSNTAILHTTFCLYMFKHSHPAYDIQSLHVQTQTSCIRHSVFTCSNTAILYATFCLYMFKHSYAILHMRYIYCMYILLALILVYENNIMQRR